MESATVAQAGIIANPASGKDIRRLVAHASVFDTAEKISMVRRVVLALEAARVTRILYMADPSRIVPRALEGLDLKAEILPVGTPLRATAEDTTAAAAVMAAAGARVIVSLGGDGTNRVLAKGASNVPLVPISTGTNNVFPAMVEATVAGLAAGAIASGSVDCQRGHEALQVDRDRDRRRAAGRRADRRGGDGGPLRRSARHLEA